MCERIFITVIAVIFLSLVSYLIYQENGRSNIEGMCTALGGISVHESWTGDPICIDIMSVIEIKGKG